MLVVFIYVFSGLPHPSTHASISGTDNLSPEGPSAAQFWFSYRLSPTSFGQPYLPPTTGPHTIDGFIKQHPSAISKSLILAGPEHGLALPWTRFTLTLTARVQKPGPAYDRSRPRLERRLTPARPYARVSPTTARRQCPGAKTQTQTPGSFLGDRHRQRARDRR